MSYVLLIQPKLSIVFLMHVIVITFIQAQHLQRSIEVDDRVVLMHKAAGLYICFAAFFIKTNKTNRCNDSVDFFQLLFIYWNIDILKHPDPEGYTQILLQGYEQDLFKKLLKCKLHANHRCQSLYILPDQFYQLS